MSEKRECKGCGRYIPKYDIPEVVGRDLYHAECVPGKILSWNTGRIYTEHGQRIAAMKIGNGVFMSDQDRGIDYYLPDCELDQREIMRRYDYNENCQWALPLPDGGNRIELVDKLNKESANCQLS